jgi:lysophospholipase L1-like esterase
MKNQIRPSLTSSNFRTSVFATLLSLIAFSNIQAEVAVKDGEGIAFLGDSITAYGAGTAGGYVNLIISGLKTSGVKIGVAPAGVPGNTSTDMLQRLDSDVLSKKVNWMTLSCGVNDVANGIPFDKYKENITTIVDKAQAAGLRVMILTTTMIREDQKNEFNQKLVAYNDFLKSLATQKQCLLADLNTVMQDQIASTPHAGNLLTVDGIHMNFFGNQMMAVGVLKAFGLDDAQIQKAREAWLDIPNVIDLSGQTSISLRQYNQLQALASGKKQGLDSVIANQFNESVQTLLKTEPQK